ncbi:MAG: hypothetical protein E6G63_07540 [Actinobacteria bacterium]|nr:MAG: hypothetical protein E6G63_07540 [Actinomycetota bacterium]
MRTRFGSSASISTRFAVGSKKRSVKARAKKVLELALREAKSLRHDYIGTEHILLGLVREREGLAAGILAEREVSDERVRTVVSELISGN